MYVRALHTLLHCLLYSIRDEIVNCSNLSNPVQPFIVLLYRDVTVSPSVERYVIDFLRFFWALAPFSPSADI